jgi:hypothetical protein
LKAYCSDRLDARRATLQAMLEGRVEPLSTVSAPRAGRDATTAPRKSEEGTEGQIAATRDAAPPKRRTSRRSLGVGALVTLGLLLAATGIALTSRHATSPAATAAAPGATLTSDRVDLDITGDSAIATVRTPGLLDSHVSGATAHLVVERWAGELPIDVVLADGRPARVVALSDGPRQLVVSPLSSAQLSASSAPSATSAPAVRPGPRAPSPGPTPNPELHRNPYGP